MILDIDNKEWEREKECAKRVYLYIFSFPLLEWKFQTNQIKMNWQTATNQNGDPVVPDYYYYFASKGGEYLKSESDKEIKKWEKLGEEKIKCFQCRSQN